MNKMASPASARSFLRTALPPPPTRPPCRCAWINCNSPGPAPGAPAGSRDQLWRDLQLDSFFAPLLGKSREGTDWEKVLRVLTLYRLLSPGSEWRLHRHWFGTTALADLLDADERLARDDTLYRGLDGLLAHKDALFAHLRQRWSDLFGAKFGVLLYDLTSTCCECDVPEDETDPRRFGYSRDKRSDCVQVIVVLVVTPEGLPLAYEMFPGHTADKTTLKDMLALIQKRYGSAERIWVMDRGIPTEGRRGLHPFALRAQRIGVKTQPCRHPQGSVDQTRKGTGRKTLAGNPSSTAREAPAPGRRSLCAGPERCAHRQRTRHAPAQTQSPLATPGRNPAARPHP
jgi:hypothetical protein